MCVITYQLKLQSGIEHIYKVDIERPDRMQEQNNEEHPEWTRLEQHQCSNCPFPVTEVKYCPAAIELEDIAAHFADATSIDRADVWVHTAERSYFKNCDIQTMLQSLYGLIMASSACPILSRLKPLSRHHLPFATVEETVQRIVGTYLVQHYIQPNTNHSEIDRGISAIHELYKDLNVVNNALMKRIRQASSDDANINAIHIFVSLTRILEMSVSDLISKMIPLPVKSQ